MSSEHALFLVHTFLQLIVSPSCAVQYRSQPLHYVLVPLKPSPFTPNPRPPSLLTTFELLHKFNLKKTKKNKEKQREQVRINFLRRKTIVET